MEILASCRKDTRKFEIVLLLGMAASALRLVKLRIPSLCETWELKDVGDRVFGTRVMSSSRRWSSELELEFRMSIR